MLQAQPEPGSVAAIGRPAGAGAPGGNAMTTDWLNRTTLLWGVLVLAVLVLGGSALSLFLLTGETLKGPLRRSLRVQSRSFNLSVNPQWNWAHLSI